MYPERTIGNYVLGAVLGRGGAGEVYAATHRFLDDRVAIKRLRACAGEEATAALVAEATRTRAIDHPNVVRVLDAGCDGDDFYLVMERLEGESLAARLARVGRLDEGEVRRLGAAIADGVAAAHARGIVHRDLKPGNVMLVADEPKIVDFGIARHVGGAAAATTGSRVGTLAYMAPEQLTGGLVAPCVDIWALGVVLYEALAGRLPFVDFADGRCPQLFETPRRIGEVAAVSPALDALIGACLERDPGKRPASMAAVAGALRAESSKERITEDVPPSIGEAATSQPARVAVARAPRRRRAAAAAGAIAALAAVAIGWTLREPLAPTADRGSGDRGVVVADGSAPPPPVSADRADIAGAAPAERGAPDADRSATTSAAPQTFSVEVRSAPAGASVIVDGKRVGVTPATVALAGPTSIVVVRGGYRPSRVKAERAGPIDVRLVPVRRTHHARPAAGETLD